MQTINLAFKPGLHYTINLGARGTYNTLQYAIDMGAFVQAYGSGTTTLFHKRSQDDAAYAVLSSINETFNWTVSAVDTAYTGEGTLEIVYEPDDNSVAKSATCTTYVTSSLTAGLAIPESVKSWYAAMIDYINSITDKIENSTATATTLAEGLDATASVSYSDGSLDFAFGIPKGPKGDQGIQGYPGNGIASISFDNVTHVMTITDDAGNTWVSGSLQGDIGPTGNGIASIAKTSTAGLVDTYTVTMTDGTTSTFSVTNGSNISSITKTASLGLADGYTVTLTDGTTTTFTVYNGNGITGIAKTATSGLNDTYTITFDDGTTDTYVVTNGSGISGIAKTGTAGLVDTYTVTFDDGTTTTFTVTNGQDADQLVGDLTALTTTDKTDAVSAINEVGDEVEDVRSELNNAETVLVNSESVTGEVFAVWEEGAINNGTGEDATSSYFRVRTSNYIRLPITVTPDATVKFSVVYYDSTYTFVAGETWATTETELSYNGATYCRIMIGYSDNSETTVATLSALVGLSRSPSTASIVENTELNTINDYTFGFGWINNSNVWNNVTTSWKHAVIPVSSGDVIEFETGSVNGYIAFVTAYSTPVDSATPSFSAVSGYTGKFATSASTVYSYTAPSDAVYMIVSLNFSGTTNEYSYFNINGYDIMLSARDNITNALAETVRSSRPVWYALGDSITQGYTSVNGAISSVTSFNYVYYVAKYNNYQATNYGVGGAGYNHEATVGDLLNARDHVDTIDFSECDLATLAYGVNDWHYDCAIGTVDDDASTGGTMASNMKYCIEKILTDNPLCKIIVLLPMNNSAFGTGNTEANNWGLGATFDTSGTLQDVIDVQIAICEYYGIEYIDQSKTSVVNRYNIQTLLSDGTHPIASAYPVIGANLAKMINFN